MTYLRIWYIMTPGLLKINSGGFMSLNEDQDESMSVGFFRKIEGLSEAKTLEERVAIYEAEKKKSFTAFVQRYGCPFGGDSVLLKLPELQATTKSFTQV